MRRKFISTLAITALFTTATFVASNPLTAGEETLMVKKRTEVQQADKWNVERIYSDEASWEQAYEKLVQQDIPQFVKESSSYKGQLGEDPASLKDLLNKMFETSRNIEKLYIYAHLRNDEDTIHDGNKTAHKKITTLLHQFSEQTAWIDPAILALPDETLTSYMKGDTLEDLRFYLEKIVRVKKHTLAPEMEELLAKAGDALGTSGKAFRALNDSDFKFHPVLDQNGEEKELTHGNYYRYITSPDRTLRENAFKGLHYKFKKYENTLCETLNGTVQTHWFTARARNYNSSMEAALDKNNIEPEVYNSLIDAVHEGIGSLHKYVRLRKRLLGVDEIHLYDMYAPILPKKEIEMSYEEAEQNVIASVAPLGEEYQEMLRKGLLEERWVDRYENENKRSGAYSSGCYDTEPFILMNYKGTIRDVFTLAHEAGHSMHSKLSRANQPYQYGDYSIFVAEVASTFNETLLRDRLLKKSKDKEERIFLIGQAIDDIRSTLFRQTMFAEFERRIHTMAEENTPLTPTILKEEYRKLNAFYFGEDAVLDDEIAIEWARIPHFHYNFYVYQYATGISAALTLADRVLKGDEVAREDYLNFLKAGNSKYPIDVLKMAGADMTQPEVVKNAIRIFDELVEELDQLTASEVEESIAST